jgi:hypothetical protein
MSEPAPVPDSALIVRILADYARAIEALAATSADSVDPATLRVSYEGTVNLARALNTSENLTDRFTALAAEIEDLSLDRDAAVADRNTLSTRVTQLESQISQTLAFANLASSSVPAPRKMQPDPKPFTGEERNKLRSFVTMLHLRLIDRPSEFPDEQSKLRYAFSRLDGPTLEQMLHLVENDHVNLETFVDFVTTLEESYGDPDHINTAKRAIAKLRQRNRDFVTYYAEFRCLASDLHWNNAAKRAAFHRGLCDELKDILSTQDVPEDWYQYVALVKWRDQQFRARKAESAHPTTVTKPASSLPRSIPPACTQNTPHPTSSGRSHFGPAPMDLSAARQRLSPEECQKRMDENRCLYCGGFNHMAQDCPSRPKVPAHPLRVAAAEVTNRVEEDGEDVVESGNV